MTDFSGESRTTAGGPTPFAPVSPRGDDGPPRRTDPIPSTPSTLPGAPNGAQSATGAATAPTAPEVKGRIEVADEVVEKVAGLAATEVDGVADLGGDIERAIESVRERIGIGNKRGDQGIKAKVSGRDVSIDVVIVIEYGHVVMDVARTVKNNVARQTNRMLGLNVVEVNVTVDDIRLPNEAKDDEDDDGLVSLEG